MLINPAVYPTFAIAALLFWFGHRFARSKVGFVTAIIAALPCVACDLFYTHLFDSWLWFYKFRAARFSELTFAGIGLLAGIFFKRMEPETFGEKLVVPAALLVVLGLPFSKSVLAPVDYSALRPACNTEVCLQSTMSTCGPSSAATILKLYGINSSERELAREAFTYKGGTESWYLARALRKRGFKTDFILQPPQTANIPAPSIAGVTLPGRTGHFIAILDSTPETIVVGDPLSGKTVIRRANLRSRYHFTGFFLSVQPAH